MAKKKIIFIRKANMKRIAPNKNIFENLKK